MSESKPQRWSTEDFDNMGWHDNAVHALRIEEGEHGEGELILDIDYIEEWIPVEDRFEFELCPALLSFHRVTHLRVSLDYAGPSAGLCPFSLEGIERTVHTYPNGHQSFAWVLRVNWPVGEISFHSPGFTQLQAAPCLRSQRPSLEPSERCARGP